MKPQGDCVAFLAAVISYFSFEICAVGISEFSISEAFLALTSKGPPDTIVASSKLSSPLSSQAPPPPSSPPPPPPACSPLALVSPFSEKALSASPTS